MRNSRSTFLETPWVTEGAGLAHSISVRLHGAQAMM